MWGRGLVVVPVVPVTVPDAILTGGTVLRGVAALGHAEPAAGLIVTVCKT